MAIAEIPAKFQKEFLAEYRKVAVDVTKGTNKIDARLFNEVISKVLNNAVFMKAISKDIVLKAMK
jgi:hypothetical protein